MSKFIEITDRGDKNKSLVSIDKIIFVEQHENGLAFINTFISYDCENTFGLSCYETYVEVFNMLCEAGFKFIEVTYRDDKTKVLVPIDKIRYVEEEENGLANICLFVSNDLDVSFAIPCAETYVDIFNMLYKMELI